MKNKILTIGIILSILLATFAIQTYEPAPSRYQQHLEEAGFSSCQTTNTFCTHLPLFHIHTQQEIPTPYLMDAEGKPLKQEDGRVLFNDEIIDANIEYFNNTNHENQLDNRPDIDEEGQIRARGNSSRLFDKKNYLLKFNEKIAIDGMSPDNTWTLHGPFLDKTLIRNYMCNNIVAQVEGYAPNVRFCELFINKEYMGVYLLTEKINYNKEGRVNISKTDPKSAETSYILRLDSGETDSLHSLTTFADDSGRRGMSTRHYEKLEILYPNATLTEDQKEWIRYEVSRFEKALIQKQDYSQYIDVDSFVNYYILSEFFMNLDAGKRSTYLVKDLRGKYEIAGWDYNNTFNNYFDDLSHPQKFYVHNVWYDQLLKDPDFVDKVIKKYKKLRKNILSDEYLYEYIDSTIDYLGPAIQRNNQIWGYSMEKDFIQNPNNTYQVVYPLSRNPKSYQQAVDQLKKAISQRGKFLDENIETLKARTEKR